MSCSVTLCYNAYSQAATLTCDTCNLDREGSKIKKALIGHPMSDWLDARTKGYLQWNGFLPELVTELNDVDITLTFEGTNEDYARFAEAVRRQAVALQATEFDTIQLNIKHTEAFSARKLLANMRALRKQWKTLFPTQKLIFKRNDLDYQLNSDSLTAQEILALYDSYYDLLRELPRHLEGNDQQTANKMYHNWEALLQSERRRNA